MEPIRLYTLKQIAPLWNLSPWEIRALIKSGKIRPIVGIGKGFRFDGTELQLAKLERL